MEKEKLGYLLIIVTMLIWGSIGIIVRLIPYPAELIVFYRVVFAFIALVIYIIASNKKVQLAKLSQNYKFFLGSGLALAFNWVFFFQAVKTTTIANATLSYYTAPIMATLLSSLWLKEKLTTQGIIALVLSFLGLGMIFVPAGYKLGGGLGIGYGLLAALFYALFTVLNKKFTEIKAYFLTLVQTGVTILVLLPFAWQYQQPAGKSILLLILLGVVHTALALILYLKGLNLSKVQEVGVLSYLDPVSAILLAVIFLGEVPSGLTLVGGSLILLASYLVVKGG